MTEINNRKAKFDYQIFDTYEAGIALTGTEIKSIRLGNCNLKDSYVVIRNNEAYIINMHIIKTVIPIIPVCTQIYTYSESGGIFDNKLNLLFAGILDWLYPMPIPHGASFKYFFMEALLMSRTLADASDLSKAERIRRICWLPLPILVKTRNPINKAKNIPKGIAILNDLDNTTYTMKPAAIQKIAVRVPDWNIPHITQMLINRKNSFSHLILLVMAMIKKDTALAAALQP